MKKHQNNIDLTSIIKQHCPEAKTLEESLFFNESKIEEYCELLQCKPNEYLLSTDQIKKILEAEIPKKARVWLAYMIQDASLKYPDEKFI